MPGAGLLARGFMRLRPLTHPVTCLVVFALVVAFTHLPSFYDAALHHAILHDLEHGLTSRPACCCGGRSSTGTPCPATGSTA